MFLIVKSCVCKEVLERCHQLYSDAQAMLAMPTSQHLQGYIFGMTIYNFLDQKGVGVGGGVVLWLTVEHTFENVI